MKSIARKIGWVLMGIDLTVPLAGKGPVAVHAIGARLHNWGS